MNILAKICVVVLVVAALVASVVFTSLATVAPNWRALYQQEHDAYERLEAKSREYKENASRLATENNELQQKLASVQSESQQRLHACLEENKKLEVENAAQSGKINEISVELNALRNTIDEQTKLISAYKTRLEESFSDANKLRVELMQVSDNLKECQAEKERYQRNQKVIKENAEYLKAQLSEKENTIARLRAGGAEVSREPAAETAPIPTHKITGRISAVTEGLASVNVGSAHGVSEGMRLIIYRGDQFVGHLKIEQVGVNESAGVVVDRRLTPRQGDSVTSNLE